MEPMNLGSPTQNYLGTPNHLGSPVGGGSQGYLPGFLLGDPHPMSPSSPLVTRQLSSPGKLNRSMSNMSSGGYPSVNSTPLPFASSRGPGLLKENLNQSGRLHSRTEKPGGPPTTSLLSGLTPNSTVNSPFSRFENTGGFDGTPSRTQDIFQALLSEEQGRDLIVSLSQEFHRKEWMTGTGGALALKTEAGILVTPSGVLKETQHKDDIFLTSDSGEILSGPVGLKISSCLPNFRHIYRLRNDVNTIFHLHSISAVLVSLLWPGHLFRVKHLQMIKGMKGFGWEDALEVPIVENRATEDSIAELIEEALHMGYKANCILIRRHGLYTWGDSWQQAKIHAESLDWVFKVAIEMRKNGLDTESYNAIPAETF